MAKLQPVPEIKYPSKDDLDLLYSIIPDGYKLQYNGNIAVICAALLGAVRACFAEIHELRGQDPNTIINVHGNYTMNGAPGKRLDELLNKIK